MNPRTGLAAGLALLLTLNAGLGERVVSASPRAGGGVASAGTAPAPRRIALIVGINDYPNLEPRYQLEGPVNDAVLLAQKLEDLFAFQPQNVHLLLGPRGGGCPRVGDTRIACSDHGVSKRAILDAFQRYLIAEARPGDILVFAYAGHGSRWQDSREPSRQARTLVPSDSRDLSGSGTDIVNAELRGLVLQALKGNPLNLTIILDSCYSGSPLFRGQATAVARGLSPDKRPSVQAWYRGRVQTASSRGADPVDQPFFTVNENHYVLLAGASSEQLSWEDVWDVDGKRHGYFTAALVEAMQGRTATTQTTYRALQEWVNSRVQARSKGQQLVPMPEGDTDMVAFGGQVRSQQPYLIVSGAAAGPQGPRAELQGGQAAGVTVGSMYEVYPATDFSFADPKQRLGEARVEHVYAGTAIAAVTSGTAPAGSHAVERIHAQAEALRVRVFTTRLPGAVINTVVAGLQKPFQFQLTAGAAYDVAVADTPGKSGFVRIALPNGDPIGGDFAASDPRTAAWLTDTLKKYARVRLAWSLENPSTRLRFAVDWNAVENPHTHTGAPLPLRGGLPVLRAEATVDDAQNKGDRVEFVISNTSPCPLYAAIVNIAVDGTVTVFPGNDDDGKKLDPKHQPWTFGFAEVIPTGMPGFKRGTDAFKVVVATKPLHLQSLAQQGYQFVPEEPRGTGRGRGPVVVTSAACDASDLAVKDFVVWVDRAAK